MSAPCSRRWVFLAAIVLVPCSAGWSQAADARKPPVVPESVTVERDVEYGKAGERPLLLDILQPKQPSARPRPAIVFIHGGGWRGGNKSGALGQLVPLAASGEYFCASVGYRLSGEAIWPAQIHDCKAAIRWLKANARKYNIDPAKIGVWGGSAGGHLVSMLGVTGDLKALEGNCGSPDASSRVACVVDYCGPSDFPAIARAKEAEGRTANGAIAMLLGGPVEEKREAAKQASPITYATKDAAPILIVHGTSDNVVPLSQAETFHAALRKAGANSTFIRIEGGGHAIGGPEITERVRAFFDKHLRGRDVAVSDKPILAPPPPPKR